MTVLYTIVNFDDITRLNFGLGQASHMLRRCDVSMKFMGALL